MIGHPADQLLKSSTSIGANLEEAIAAQSKADFIHKCSIAVKEAREARYWLRLIAHTSGSHDARLGKLAEESGELVAILSTIVKNTRPSSSLR